MHTAQWEGVGKHCHDPHCFPLQSQLGQAQHREFPTLDSDDGMPSGTAEPWPWGSQ